MTFKIEVTRSGPVTTVRLIGRLRSENVEELKKYVEQGGGPVVLDLAEVALVDVGVVRFLIECENRGAQIANGSLHIRKWMLREREQE
jgi:anti-anti-sigma regulatory factor